MHRSLNQFGLDRDSPNAVAIVIVLAGSALDALEWVQWSPHMPTQDPTDRRRYH